jgi:putative IMPACT (imprinted ancient) family translation regulator
METVFPQNWGQKALKSNRRSKQKIEESRFLKKIANFHSPNTEIFTLSQASSIN